MSPWPRQVSVEIHVAAKIRRALYNIGEERQIQELVEDRIIAKENIGYVMNVGEGVLYGLVLYF